MKILALTDAVGNCPSYRARLLPFLPLLEREGIQVEVHRKLPDDVTRYDAVWLRRVLLAKSARDKLHGLPIIYDFDDATYLSGVEIGGGLRPPSFPDTIQVAHTVLAGSETLALEAKRAGAKRVKVLRTGLPVVDYFVMKPEVPPVLVWTGSGSTLPYLLLIEPALKRVIQEVPVSLRVVCDLAPMWSLPYEFIQWSPEVQGPALAGASIGLAPLPNTPSAQGKCGFKIIQYMASGLPVVASSVGANRELFDDGCQGLCVSSTEDFYGAILTTLAQPWTGANRGIAEKSFDLPVLFRTLHETFLGAVCESPS